MALEHLPLHELNQMQKDLVRKFEQRYNLILNPSNERYLNERYLTDTVAIITSILTIVDHKLQPPRFGGSQRLLNMLKDRLRVAQSEVLEKLQILRSNKPGGRPNPAYHRSNFPNMKGVSVRRTGSYACMQLCNPYTV